MHYGGRGAFSTTGATAYQPRVYTMVYRAYRATNNNYEDPTYPIAKMSNVYRYTIAQTSRAELCRAHGEKDSGECHVRADLKRAGMRQLACMRSFACKWRRAAPRLVMEGGSATSASNIFCKI